MAKLLNSSIQRGYTNYTYNDNNSFKEMTHLIYMEKSSFLNKREIFIEFERRFYL